MSELERVKALLEKLPERLVSEWGGEDGEFWLLLNPVERFWWFLLSHTADLSSYEGMYHEPFLESYEGEQRGLILDVVASFATDVRVLVKENADLRKQLAESELKEEELNAITGRRSDLTAQLSKTQDALERMRANVEIAGGDDVLSDDPQTFYDQVTARLRESGWGEYGITEFPEGTMWDKWYKDSDTYYVRRNLGQYDRGNMSTMFDAAVSQGLAIQDKPVYRWVKA